MNNIDDETEDDQFLIVVKSVIPNIKVFGTAVKGFVDSEIDIRRSLLQKLQEIGYTFSIRRSLKLSGRKIEFRHNRGDLPVWFFGFPYVKTSVCVYECAHGPKYYKRLKYEEQPIDRKQRMRQSTIKINCEAEMKVLNIIYFPEFKAKSLPSAKATTEIISEIRKDFDDIRKVKRTFVLISLPKVHNHQVTTSLLNQRISHEVKGEIRRLVNEGITDTKSITVSIKEMVSKSCSPNLSWLSKAYFPDLRTIRNYINKCKKRRRRRIEREGEAENTHPLWTEEELTPIEPVYEEEITSQLVYEEEITSQSVYEEEIIPQSIYYEDKREISSESSYYDENEINSPSVYEEEEITLYSICEEEITSHSGCEEEIILQSAYDEDEGEITTQSVYEDEGEITTQSVYEDEGVITTQSVYEDEGEITTQSVYEDEGEITTHEEEIPLQLKYEDKIPLQLEYDENTGEIPLQTVYYEDKGEIITESVYEEEIILQSAYDEDEGEIITQSAYEEKLIPQSLYEDGKEITSHLVYEEVVTSQCHSEDDTTIITSNTLENKKQYIYKLLNNIGNFTHELENENLIHKNLKALEDIAKELQSNVNSSNHTMEPLKQSL